MRINKNILYISLTISAFLALSSLYSYQKQRHIQQNIADNVVRLHILANSDDEKDQENKLLVRDAVLSDMAPYMTDTFSKEEALTRLRDHLDDIEQTANLTLSSLGDTNTVTLSLSRDYFPEKKYGDMTFPKGYYDALRISIGEADGHNWWCVMYPSLCFIDASTVYVPEDSCKLLKDTLEPASYEYLFTAESDTKTVFRFRYLTFLNFLFE